MGDSKLNYFSTPFLRQFNPTLEEFKKVNAEVGSVNETHGYLRRRKLLCAVECADSISTLREVLAELIRSQI